MWATRRCALGQCEVGELMPQCPLGGMGGIQLGPRRRIRAAKPNTPIARINRFMILPIEKKLLCRGPSRAFQNPGCSDERKGNTKKENLRAGQELLNRVELRTFTPVFGAPCGSGASE